MKIEILAYTLQRMKQVANGVSEDFPLFVQ